VLQCRDDLSDRPAAEAVRARSDGKYLLGLEMTGPGCDATVLSEFRAWLLAGAAAGRLLEQLLGRCKQPGLLKGRGRQRIDATDVRASVRTLNRLEWLAETLRSVR
jgi:transposase